jgi:hypothetical protein
MSKVYSANPMKGLPVLVKDIEKIFTEDNFPGADPRWLDAARHFYGQAYATKKYGWGVARTSGIYNEASGFFQQGQTISPVSDDFENNKRGRNYYYTDESVPYLNLIEEVINNPDSLTLEAKDSLMNNAKSNAIYAHEADKVENLSRWGRYNPGRIMEFLKEVY